MRLEQVGAERERGRRGNSNTREGLPVVLLPARALRAADQGLVLMR